jgi:hypothetical protein
MLFFLGFFIIFLLSIAIYLLRVTTFLTLAGVAKGISFSLVVSGFFFVKIKINYVGMIYLLSRPGLNGSL